jgi:hypothetical protein
MLLRQLAVNDESEFDADCSGSYRMTCLTCGYYESESLRTNADGVCCGSLRVIGKGFGVLRYRYLNDNFYTTHFMKTTRQALDAARWLRRMLRCGAVDPETAYVTRWNDDLNRIEILVRNPVDLLVGEEQS